MYSDQIKVDEFYYAISDGQFIGTYYVSKKHNDYFTCLTRYFPNNEWVVTYFGFESYDWEDDEQVDSEVEYIGDLWLQDSTHISSLNWEKNRDIKKYFTSFIPHIFVKGLPQ